MEKYLKGGKIVTTHGIRGEAKVQPWTDSPDVFSDLEKLYTKNGETVFEVQNAREHKGMIILKLKGIDTVEAAQKLINTILYVDRNDIELDDGAYFIQDIIGLEVFDIDNGKCYGKVSDVTSTGANDVFHITKDNKTYLIPNIKSVVINIDVEGKKIEIRPLEGLLEYEN